MCVCVCVCVCAVPTNAEHSAVLEVVTAQRHKVACGDLAVQEPPLPPPARQPVQEHRPCATVNPMRVRPWGGRGTVHTHTQTCTHVPWRWKPSWWHTTMASSVPNWFPHTVPQALLIHTSTLPLTAAPPSITSSPSLTSPWLHSENSVDKARGSKVTCQDASPETMELIAISTVPRGNSYVAA